MSDTVTDTIACIGKNLLNNHKLSIGIVICPILSDTNTVVSKKFAYTYVQLFYQALNELICPKKCLKGP
jgi:hypothetical protein